MYIYKNIEISHLHKYSDPLLSTLLKHLWQRLQPRVFLGMTLQAWHTCIWGVSPILLCRSSQALSGWMGSLQRCSIGFKSGLCLGHSRTFRDLSWSHSCNVLAVCLGLLSCWKGNLVGAKLMTMITFPLLAASRLSTVKCWDRMAT